MPEYLSPGVYVEEIDAGPKPIEGVSTSTAGAVGVTVRGPTRGRSGPYTGKPELVTSFTEFVRKFGGFVAEPAAASVNAWALNASEGGRWWQFPLAVKGFFDNGGQRLYVKRVYSSTAQLATATCGQGLLAELTQDATAADKALRVRHLIGAQVGAKVKIFMNGFALPTAFTVTAYDGTESLTLNTAVGQELKAGRDYVELIAPQTVVAGAPDPRLRVFAKSEGDWGGNEVDPTGIAAGNGLSVRVRPMVAATMKIMADPAIGGSPLRTISTVLAPAAASTVTLASVAGLLANDKVLIDGAEYTVTAIAGSVITINPPVPGKAAIAATPGVPAVPAQPGPPPVPAVPAVPPVAAVPGDAGWPAGTAVRRLLPANTTTAAVPSIRVWNAAQLYRGALVELDNGNSKEVRLVLSMADNTVTFSGGSFTGLYFEEHRLRVIEAEVGVVFRHNQATEAAENYSNLRLVDDGTANYLVTAVNRQSALINLGAGDGFSVAALAQFPSVAPAAAAQPARLWMDLTGGRDNLAALSVDDFVGEDGGPGNRTGIQSLEDIDEVSICLAPGMWAASVHAGLIQHCELLKDRFAILDPQDGLSIEGIRTFREPLDTKYAALYYPWLEVRDPSVKMNVAVGPSGHMAGIYARVDVERGVHKAPANEIIRGITRIMIDVSKREHDMLNPKNINVLRYFPGRGNRVWGARVVTSDAAWKYVNVRRLFLFVEESIDEGTQWVVFEPNDEPLWARVRQTIGNFLTSVWRSGALQGAKADEAFFVKCDRSTMTQDDIDNGRLICQIGIAPVKPAEFVIFRIQQKTTDSLNA